MLEIEKRKEPKDLAWCSQISAQSGTPDCPVVHRTVSGAPDWSPVKRPLSGKGSVVYEFGLPSWLSGGALDCPVCQATEGKNCLPRLLSTAPSCLGAIKGTPRRMEE